MTKQIIFSTLRDNKGATGGPGGVLYMLKETIGDNINNRLSCKYEFNAISKNIRGKNLFNKIIFAVKAFIRKNSYYVVHDIDAAYILAKLKIKYSLIYHNQGPITQEALNFGVKLTESKIEKNKKKEKIAFTNAVSLHFPSIGASNMYFTNKYKACELNETNIKEPLYNTIPNSSLKKIDELKKDNDILTLFSLGTLTLAKGQDNVTNFIESLLKKSKLPVRYIIVGNGPLKETLINRLDKLVSLYPSFNYYYKEKLSHPEVMYIHSISDIYIMLHRLSIFDFATLEAMSQNTAIVLSPIGGNIDFDKESNIIYVSNNFEEGVQKLIKTDINLLKEKNRNVFETYFSIDAFKNEYIKMINKNLSI